MSNQLGLFDQAGVALPRRLRAKCPATGAARVLDVLDAGTSYEGLVDALRKRRASLGLAQLDLDALAGLASGHVAKIEAPRRTGNMRRASDQTLSILCQALGVRITLTEDPEAVAALRPRIARIRQGRAGSGPRSSPRSSRAS